MTQEELKFYNSLPPCWKTEFNDYKSKHPEWGLIQLMNRISIGITLEGEDCQSGFINKPPIPPITPTNPVFLKTIMGKADKWMSKNIPPDLYKKVSPAFQAAIMFLDNLIATGITIVKNLWNKICEFFN